jgi:hypothetical protein
MAESWGEGPGLSPNLPGPNVLPETLGTGGGRWAHAVGPKLAQACLCTGRTVRLLGWSNLIIAQDPLPPPPSPSSPSVPMAPLPGLVLTLSVSPDLSSCVRQGLLGLAVAGAKVGGLAFRPLGHGVGSLPLGCIP